MKDRALALAEDRALPWWPNGWAARIHAGIGGHESEIVLNIDDYDHYNSIPDDVVTALKRELPTWLIENRSSRIELHPTGRFAGGFTEADVEAACVAARLIGLDARKVVNPSL